MSDKIQKEERKKVKMSFFEYATEVIGWLQIVASPLLGGLVIAALIYFSNPTILRLLIAIGIALIGLIVGIVFDTRIWKKQGTMHFLSRVSATPELDNLDEEKK
jgi:hypothetical protein